MRTFPVFRHLLNVAVFCALAIGGVVSSAHAEKSAELYTTSGYQFGRFEARVQFAFGDGVVSSFFLWKAGSEKSSVFWNELDFEKLGAECELETNALYGDPESVNSEEHELTEDLCGTFHTYTYEWTPEYIAWFINGVEIRREVGETAVAYADNTSEGMQLRFNIWPGDETFGGNFDPAILPVHQYINWVQYSSYENGEFTFEWREDFSAATRPSGWATASWESPKNLSRHSTANVAFINGYAVLSLTADDATGSAGAMPLDPDEPIPPPSAVDDAVTPAATDGTAAAAGTMVPPTGTVAGGTPESDSGGEESCSFRRLDRRSGFSWAWGLIAVAASLTVARRRA